MADHAPMSVFTDERGRLIPIEFNDLPFSPRRCFVVTAPGRPADRGGHQAECRQVLVLLRGSATVQLGVDHEVTVHHLSEPGDAVSILATDVINYRLETADTEVLILAEEPFAARS